MGNNSKRGVNQTSTGVPTVDIPQNIQDELTKLFKKDEAFNDYEWDISEDEEDWGNGPSNNGGTFTDKFGSEYDYGYIDRNRLNQLRRDNRDNKRELFDEIERITGLNVYNLDDLDYVLPHHIHSKVTGAPAFYTTLPDEFEEYSNNPSYEKQYAIIPQEIYDSSVGEDRVDHVVGVDLTPKVVFVKK